VVWDALTRRDAVQPFYFGSVLRGDLRAGQPFEYQSTNGKISFIMGEVLEVEPPQVFAHTLRFTDLAEAPTRVTFRLEDAQGGTTVTVTHEQLHGAPRTRKRVTRGWPAILRGLAAVIERGRLPVGLRLQYGLMNLIMPLVAPKRPQ
jgi:uncharacterized protein YndB with AHSA1/START domain